MSSSRPKIIQPRVGTPLPGVHDTGSTKLPDELLTEHVQRVSALAAVGGGLWTYGLVMDTLVTPNTVGAPVSAVAVGIEAVAILASVVMFFYARYSRHAPQVKTDAGLAYMIVSTIAIALLNSWVRTVTIDQIGHLSWNAVAILVSSMIIVAKPRKMLIATLVAASADPLGVWFAHLRGVATPGFVNTMVIFMPNYACAIVAILPSIVLHRLGRRLRQAQDLGAYHLIELLGRGGMGEVWRGRHQLLARNAAIKLVRPELLGASTEADARTMLRRFEREAQATAALSSPHTIRVFDFGITVDRTFYYVMELLTGRDLDSLVREFGPVPAERALYLLRQVCHSLADAHARGLIHRDVTPANIYVCRLGLEYDFVKVLDFGLVKNNSSTSVERTLMTGVHTTTGTPAFMAPEIILEGAVDQRADVYAVGCVAYFLLTGQLVFEAETPMKMFVEHLQTAPIPPSQRSEMPIPREVDELILACLEKDPAKRPQSAEQLLKMIDRCRLRTAWTGDAAQGWWEQHLPELTGPLTVADAPSVAALPESPRQLASSRSVRTMPDAITTLNPVSFLS